MSSCIIAFAMYSKIPMPKIAWNEKNMKYAICYFPLIGVVIGIIEITCFSLCNYLQIGTLLRSVLLSVIPVLVTGGIHMDGYLDTVDARSSYGDRVKKLEILKDPHAGAFAMIKGILYFTLQIGFFSEISKNGMVIFSVGFVFSRALSGLALATFKGAKETGLLASFAKGTDKKIVVITMIGYMIVGSMALCGYAISMGAIENGILAFIMLVVCASVFGYYRYFSYKEFGGITGDLAGYFLQLVELLFLVMIVVIEKVYG